MRKALKEKKMGMGLLAALTPPDTIRDAPTPPNTVVEEATVKRESTCSVVKYEVNSLARVKQESTPPPRTTTTTTTVNPELIVLPNSVVST